MTQQTNQYRMPAGLTSQERQWWQETTRAIRRHKIEAWTLELQADADQRQAQMARSDFGRLRQEYRDRHSTKPQWAADFIFKRLAIAQECVTDDGWFSRQAQEKYQGATEHLEQAQTLLAELALFLVRRGEAMDLIPNPREAS